MDVVAPQLNDAAAVDRAAPSRCATSLIACCCDVLSSITMYSAREEERRHFGPHDSAPPSPSTAPHAHRRRLRRARAAVGRAGNRAAAGRAGNRAVVGAPQLRKFPRFLFFARCDDDAIVAPATSRVTRARGPRKIGSDVARRSSRRRRARYCVTTIVAKLRAAATAVWPSMSRRRSFGGVAGLRRALREAVEQARSDEKQKVRDDDDANRCSRTMTVMTVTERGTERSRRFATSTGPRRWR